MVSVQIIPVAEYFEILLHENVLKEEKQEARRGLHPWVIMHSCLCRLFSAQVLLRNCILASALPAKSCAVAWDCIHPEKREPFSNIHKCVVGSSSQPTSEAISVIQAQVEED